MSTTHLPRVCATLVFAVFATSLSLDAVGILSGRGVWCEASFWVLATGLILGFITAPFHSESPDLAPWLPVAGPRRRELPVNALMLAFFSASWLIRRESPSSPSGLALALAGGGLLLGMLILFADLLPSHRHGGADTVVRL